MPPLLTGFLLAALIALLAHRLGALDHGGAAAAVLLGSLVFGLGGVGWALLLVAFFSTSSLLSGLFAGRKASLQSAAAKGMRRDALQVLANGGAAGLCVVLHALFPQQAWLWAAFAGSLAAVNADTWATELGALSPQSPRLLTSGRVVEPGTSGGVTLTGTLAALLGAALIGALAGWVPPGGGWAAAVAVTAAGLAGSLVDSLLGAAWQAQFYCPRCRKVTERSPRHTCGSPTTLLRGQRWINNDAVNLACAASGALLAAGLFLLLAG